jgi:Smg protein
LTGKGVVNPRFAELLIHLLRRFMEQEPGTDLRPDLLAEELTAVGFQADEVSQALGWLLEKLELPSENQTAHTVHVTSRRVLHQAEAHYLTPEARSFLAELQNHSLLDPGETETLIERAIWMHRTSVPLEDLRSYVDHYMLGQARLDPGQQSRVVMPFHASRH